MKGFLQSRKYLNLCGSVILRLYKKILLTICEDLIWILGKQMAKNSKSASPPKWIAYIVVILIVVTGLIWINSQVISTGSPLGSSFSANKNFSWYYLVYHNSTGNLSLELSQNTNNTLYDVQFAFISKYSDYPNNIQEFPWNTPNAVQLNKSMYSGNIINITLPISGRVPVGTFKYGTVWIRYYVGGNLQYMSVGNATLKAV